MERAAKVPRGAEVADSSVAQALAADDAGAGAPINGTAGALEEELEFTEDDLNELESILTAKIASVAPAPSPTPAPVATNRSDDEADIEIPPDASPHTRRKLQNRAASTRFRQRAKKRETDLKSLQQKVAEQDEEIERLRQKLADAQQRTEEVVRETQESTLQWILSNFWLRRKIHLSTVARTIAWARSGIKHKEGAGAKGGLSEAAAQ